MSTPYVPPSLRNRIKPAEKPVAPLIVEPTAKPLIVVESAPSKYIPPNKRGEGPLMALTGPLSALTSVTSFPSLGSVNTPGATAPTMNYLQKIRDAEAARQEEDVSNEALERDGWRIMNMSIEHLRNNVSAWYDRVFYEEECLPF